jgi:hypothetical protein
VGQFGVAARVSFPLPLTPANDAIAQTIADDLYALLVKRADELANRAEGSLSMGAELSPNVGFQFSLVWRDEDCIGDQPLS